MAVTNAPAASGLAATRAAVAGMSSWPLRRWFAAALATAVAALAIGVPTGVVETSFYTRMTPVTWWNYPVWAVSAVLVGLITATYVRGSELSDEAPDRSRRTVAAAVLSAFAVGCPVCNKLVIALIGVSGALSYWAPLQPLLGVLSIGVLAAGLVVRLRGAVTCAGPVAR